MSIGKKDATQAMLIMNDKNYTGHVARYDDVSRIMLIGGENFKGYCESAEISGKKAFIPCGSGDQSLELIQRGFEDVTAFDINKLSKYILKTKIAAVLSLTYEEYMRFITSLFKENDIKSKIYSLLDEETKDFFDYLLSNNSSYTLRSSLFSHTYISTELLKRFKNNFSVYDERGFYELKKKLLNSKITFKQMDLYNPSISDEYDFIYFSNILLFADDLKIDDFANTNIKEYLSALSPSGIIGLHYAHLYKNEPEVNYKYPKEDILAQLKNDEIFKHLEKYSNIETILSPSGFGRGLKKDDMVLSFRK